MKNTGRAFAVTVFLAAPCVVGCGGTVRGDALDVGSDDAGTLSLSPTGDASDPGALDAHIEQNRVVVKVVALSCAGDCATVQAVAAGGYPPYTFRWDDGSTNATRKVCPRSDAHYDVKVSDTGTSGELARASQTVDVPLTADVLTCQDGGGAPAGLSDAGACDRDAGFGAAAMLPQTLTLDVTGPETYFVGGAPLPAGRYRVEYIDGCMMWGSTGFGWSIGEGITLGALQEECLLVGDTTTTVVGVLPGIEGAGVPKYSDCVAQSRMLPPLDVSYAGGKLGIFNGDTVQFDDIGGEAEGGVSPTWRLSLLSLCP
jgi:hypothetical protein